MTAAQRLSFGDQRVRRMFLIFGPTAVGKSALATAYARRTGAMIVNADAMQVYRDLQVLTACPESGLRREVSHVLYNHVDGADRYSVGRWLEGLEGVLGKTDANAPPPVLVGGSGLYFKALLEGLSKIPPVDPQIERDLASRARADPAALHAQLRTVDPESAMRIAPTDRARIVRSLAVCMTTGVPVRAFRTEAEVWRIDVTPVMRIVLDRPRSILRRRIALRTERMLEGQAVAEVARLLARDLPMDLPVMKAIGVRQLAGYLDGTVSREAAATSVQTESCRLAKRQMTWARHQFSDWTWSQDTCGLIRTMEDACR